MEGNNPKAELNKTLQFYKVTSHPSNSFSPAELLFERKYCNQFPQLPHPTNREDITETWQQSENASKDDKK